MTTTPQSRQPAGVPEGGQWASGVRGESDILLTAGHLPVWPKRPVTDQDIRRADDALAQIRSLMAKSDEEMLPGRRYKICREHLESLDDHHKVKFGSSIGSGTKELPRYALWSRAARDIITTGSIKGLHDEHVVPVNAQLEYIAYRDRISDPMSGEELAHMVASLPRTVVTDDEAKWVDRVGGRQTMPNPEDFVENPTAMFTRYTDPKWRMPYTSKGNGDKEFAGLVPSEQCSFSTVSELRGHDVERCGRRDPRSSNADCVLLRGHRGKCRLVERNRSDEWLTLDAGGARSADEWDALSEHLSTPARLN